MPGLCIAIVASGLVKVLPAGTMTLAWTHSVEHSRWEEVYEVRDSLLAIREARVRASGAGMDPPPDATYENGWWRYVPRLAPFNEVSLANSAHVAGYTVCWPGGGCRPLERIVARGTPVTLRAEVCVEGRVDE